MRNRKVIGLAKSMQRAASNMSTTAADLADFENRLTVARESLLSTAAIMRDLADRIIELERSERQ